MKYFRPVAAILLLGFATAGTPLHARDQHIVLASTTSTDNSGLFGHIIPIFTGKTGIEVRVVAVGTGQAFAIARAGDADALLVHDAAGERTMVSEGYALERRDVMYNDFVIIGPSSDPAGVKSAGSAAEAFALIAANDGVFASRGDDSGTHRAELGLWEKAGVTPHGSWYRELGSGMGATLNTAAAMNAYVFADRATWISFDNRQELAIVFEGDPVLFNQYGSVLLNPERNPHLKQALAKQWHEWLLSEEGQAAIADFERRGQQLFFANAK
ncbi:substrate-binding domain-containing protein [Wenzhouxiangella sp. XN24]|uniref:substrate-binding domain-containing protein n=1 Tax=Wenzhouxiangella sp. XN24 TaxID=2713569 RepID=UPI0013E9C015|nr:substrate-binding domain-containing protein [Wenzhouxiangella sp. XN24]NGX17390.1 solute-binding protein [Wenzhouxiangella sp. XN24]